MSKGAKIPLGCNSPVHRSSINLGVDFVMDKAAGVLRANPDYTEVSYCDRFTGKVCRIPMVKYFIDKVFPTYSSVPVEQRNALRDYYLSLDRSDFECNSSTYNQISKDRNMRKNKHSLISVSLYFYFILP